MDRVLYIYTIIPDARQSTLIRHHQMVPRHYGYYKQGENSREGEIKTEEEEERAINRMKKGGRIRLITIEERR